MNTKEELIKTLESSFIFYCKENKNGFELSVGSYSGKNFLLNCKITEIKIKEVK